MEANDGGGSERNSKRKTRSSTPNVCAFEINLFAFSVLKLLRRARADTTRVVRSLFRKRSATKPPVVMHRPSSSQGESHHKEAIQDCIEFINSSSFSRSNSVSEKASVSKGDDAAAAAAGSESEGTKEQQQDHRDVPTEMTTSLQQISVA